MAATVSTGTNKGRSNDVWGRRRIGVFQVTMDAAYPTGGLAFDPKQFGFTGANPSVLLFPRYNASTVGRDYFYDPVAKKIVASHSAPPVIASGRATLVAGTVTVAQAAVTSAASGQQIILTNAVAGGTLGDLSVGARSAGVNFVINSSSGTDTSQVDWAILAPTTGSQGVEVPNGTDLHLVVFDVIVVGD